MSTEDLTARALRAIEHHCRELATDTPRERLASILADLYVGHVYDLGHEDEAENAILELGEAPEQAAEEESSALRTFTVMVGYRGVEIAPDRWQSYTLQAESPDAAAMSGRRAHAEDAGGGVEEHIAFAVFDGDVPTYPSEGWDGVQGPEQSPVGADGRLVCPVCGNADPTRMRAHEAMTMQHYVAIIDDIPHFSLDTSVGFGTGDGETLRCHACPGQPEVPVPPDFWAMAEWC